MREHSLKERREILEKLIQDCDEPRLKISSCLSADSKESLEILRDSSRDFGAEGLMLKKKGESLSFRKKTWALVEIQGRSADPRCSPDLCPGGKRKKSQPVYRLHFRTLERFGTGDFCKSLLGARSERDRRTGPLDPSKHPRTFWPRPVRRAFSCF